MRSAVNIIPETGIAETVALAVEAERLGFDRCWVYDEGLATRDVWVALTAIAAATERIGLGPGITNPYTRHPAQTAAAVASLDELSGQRAFLGIGAGGSLTLDPLGLARTAPLTAVREAIEAARLLFAGGSVDYHGSTVRLCSAAIGYARPGIEIWLAGRGPKMLALGGAAADGVMLDFIHRPSLGGYVDLVRRGGPAEICYSTALVIDDADLEAVRPHMTYRLLDAPQPVKDALGMSEADTARIRAAMAGGLAEAARQVPDEWVLPFVIHGSAAECSAVLDAVVHEHGFSEFVLPMFEHPDHLRHLALAAQVIQDAAGA